MTLEGNFYGSNFFLNVTILRTKCYLLSHFPVSLNIIPLKTRSMNLLEWPNLTFDNFFKIK